MQAAFTYTYTPLKPTAAVCKGGKMVIVSHQSLLAQKNAQALAALGPIEHISWCCIRNCFSQFDNITNLNALQESYFQFSNAILKKQFLKDLLLPNVQESTDYISKHFQIGGFPVCYMYAHTLFGISNNLLTSLKGTPHANQSFYARFKTFPCMSYVPRL